MQTKKDFKYARLYNAENGTFVTDGGCDSLVMGPKTAKRFENNNDDCAVTVCCITYKHEDYIRDALDSFLMQKTNFKFKVFVGEDHGPDNTANIVKEYSEKYPDIIVPFLREKNMGAQANLIDLCNHATSPYIAFCEGDDFWTDEYKLQKQYDYMQGHPHVRMCFTRTKIEAPEDWHLRSYYKENRNGEMIIPDTILGFKMLKRLLFGYDLIEFIPLHTSTHFYRWNYDQEMPDWFYEGVEGAFPILMIQLGHGNAKFLPDVTSVYRRSDVGVLMNNNTTDHFLNTRMDYIRFLWNLREYFVENLNGYCKVQFDNRIKAEGYNLLSSAVKCEDDEIIQKFFIQYPQAARIALNSYLSFYHDSRAMVRAYSWEGYKLMVRNRVYRYALVPYTWMLKLIHRFSIFMKKCAKAFREGFSIVHFWRYSLVPKRKNLWVITSFRAKGYLDNSKYFYEYIIKHHPEIDLYWLTKDEAVYKQLRAENKPVLMINSHEGKKAMSHAYIAITDHNVMSDFSPRYGYHNRVKVVQLWHGVGFKAMGDGKNVKLVKERGVQYSSDILPLPEDGLFKRLVKKIKYFFTAYKRELFEKYFMFVCPGQERVEMIGKVWNIPEKSWFMAGHPRNELLYKMQPDASNPMILYAPTFRYVEQKENELVDGCISSFPLIQKKMEEINGTFVIRLHPHTWRDYNSKIYRHLKKYDRIKLDVEKDIYTTLGKYSVVITDYSSIAMDFAMLNRPTVFYCPDYDWFTETQAGFNLDFKSCIPGPLTQTWEETVDKVIEYCKNPEKDMALCQEKCRYFFDSSVNGPDNSERIVEEIKRRIELR